MLTTARFLAASSLLALTAFASGCTTQADVSSPADEAVTTGTTAQALTTRAGYIDIALHKPASSSSVAWDGAAARAVDGTTNGVYSAGSVTHTQQEASPWWRVELAGPRPVSFVTVYNRTDCCKERLSGAIVELLFDGQVVDERPLGVGVDLPEKQDLWFGGKLANAVRVRIPGTGILSLAEVEVWMEVPKPPPVEEGVCWKGTYGRGAGTPLSTCAAGTQLDGLLCYPTCRAGFYGVGPVCWQSCPSGYHDDGALCRRDASIVSANNNACPWYDKCGVTFAKGCSTCPAGYVNDGCTCRRDASIFAKASYGRGAGAPMQCAAGKQQDAGLCYDSCKSGFDPVGPLCWQQCNGDHPVACGALCATSQDACANAVTDMTTTTVEAIANIVGMVVSFGESAVAVSAAKTVAKEALTVAAKEAIRKEVLRQLEKQGKALAKDELENIVTGLAASVETGSFDWTTLDPTGIAAVVMAFNKPSCN